MKIYQIILNDEEGFTLPYESEMERKVEWYKENHPEMNPDYKEIEVDREDLGLCMNDLILKPKWEEECSVGMIRKGRSGTRDGLEDDMKCFSCPKWIPMEKLNEIYKEQEKSNEEKRKEYFEELGIEPKRVKEHEPKDSDVGVVEESEEEEEKEEERREEELEQYRETSGF